MYSEEVSMKKNRAVLRGCCIIIFLGIGSGGVQLLLGRGTAPSETRPPAKKFIHVKLPPGYHPPSARCQQLKGREIIVDLFAENFSQGMAVYAELYQNPSAPDADIEVKKFFFDGREIALSKREWGCRALFGINPETSAGTKSVQIVYTSKGQTGTEHFTLPVARSEFHFYPGALDCGKYSDVDYRLTPEELAFINTCAQKKKAVFGRSGQDRLGETYSHPRNRHFITSPFWSKRLIMQYRIKKGRKIRLKDKLNIHRGVDLRGNNGDPVYAMADGRVAIAEPMYYEGNFVVIDHGNRIFSYYMHLSKLTVKEGDVITAGNQVGNVGSTGLSTGAHLHVSLMIQDIPANPLSILMLPVRN